MARFGYAFADDLDTPPDDSAFKNLYYEPSDIVDLSPSGLGARAGDGSVLFYSQPTISILFPGLLYTHLPPDAESVNGVTASELYRDWHKVRNDYNQQVWIRVWLPMIYNWAKLLAVWQYPSWSGKLRGIAILNLILEFKALGLNISDYKGGAIYTPVPDYYSKITGLATRGDAFDESDGRLGTGTGDTFTGGYGVGTYGSGYYGQGGW